MSERRLMVHIVVAASCGLLGLDEAPPGGGEVGEGAARGRVGGRRVPAELGRVAARRARSQLQEGRRIGQVDSYLSETNLLIVCYFITQTYLAHSNKEWAMT